MCGIVGMLDFSKTGFFSKDVSIFKELLIVNSLRGSHSTGMFGGKIEGEMDFAKAVGNPYDFIQSKDVEPLFSKMVQKHRIVVGHGRHATRGSVIGEFAHPFRRDHITMVHNGTVFSSKLVDTMRHVSDSKAICEALAANEAEEVFADINGAYAIVYHDSKKKTISLVRNKERPLMMARDAKNDRVYFSSEKNILEVVAYRNGVSLKDFLFLPEETIFTFKANDIDFTETKIKKHVPIYQVPATYVPPAQQSNTQNVRTLAITSKSTGERVKVGEQLIFFLTDFHETKSRIKGEDSFFQIFGKSPDFPELETSIVYKGKEEDIYSAPYWEGTIVSISQASANMKSKGTEWFIYLKDPKPTDKVRLADGTFMTKILYNAMVQHGCDACKEPLTLKDAEDVLIIDDAVLCKACTETYLSSLTA